MYIVRERMYQEAKEEKEREAKKSRGFGAMKTGFGNNNVTSVPESSPMSTVDTVAKGRPIADLCKLRVKLYRFV